MTKARKELRQAKAQWEAEWLSTIKEQIEEEENGLVWADGCAASAEDCG